MTSSPAKQNHAAYKGWTGTSGTSEQSQELVENPPVPSCTGAMHLNEGWPADLATAQTLHGLRP